MPNEGVLLSENFADNLAVLARASGDLLRPQHVDSETFQNPRLTATWKNTHSTTCPPYGIIAITDGQVPSDDEPYLSGTRTNSTFRRIYAANGPYEVEAGKNGQCYLGGKVLIACGESLTTGDAAGPKEDSWLVWKNYPATNQIFGEWNSTDKIFRAFLHPIDKVIGKLTADIASGNNTINIWGGTAGSEAVITGWTLTARNWSDTIGSATSGAKVHCHYKNSIWYLDRPFSSDNSIVRAKITETNYIGSGGSGSAKLWDANANDWSSSSSTVYVATMHQPAFKDELVGVTYSSSENKYYVTEYPTRTHFCTLSGSLTKGSSASANLKIANGSDISITVNSTLGDLASGKKCSIAWSNNPGSAGWYIVSGEC
jgi:hypothetical protein